MHIKKYEVKVLKIMIPIQPFSFFAIFLLFIIPLIGVVLTLGLLVKVIFFRRKKAQKPVTMRKERRNKNLIFKQHGIAESE